MHTVQEELITLQMDQHEQRIVAFFWSGSKIMTALPVNDRLSIFAEGSTNCPRAAFEFQIVKNGIYFNLPVNARYVNTVVFGQEAFHVYFLGEVYE